ncbi:MAG: hypothetical protein ABSA65_20360 [Acidimicrobiales bacterium]
MLKQVNLSTGIADYLVADSLGSVRGVVSSSGSLVGSTDYDAGGNPEITGGLSSFTPFGSAGAYTDSTDLVYLIGRFHNPTTGQFLAVASGVHRIAICRSDTSNDEPRELGELGRTM